MLKKNFSDDFLRVLDKFRKKLEKEIEATVVYEDETLTTVQAKKPYYPKSGAREIANKRKFGGVPPKTVDDSAAAIILQSWLDKKQMI